MGAVKEPSIDVDKSDEEGKKKKKKKERKEKKKDDKDRKLKKLLLEKLSEGNPDPALFKMALGLLGGSSDQKKDQDRDKHSPSPPPRKKSPKRNVIADGENFTVTVGRTAASSP